MNNNDDATFLDITQDHELGADEDEASGEEDEEEGEEEDEEGGDEEEEEEEEEEWAFGSECGSDGDCAQELDVVAASASMEAKAAKKGKSKSKK